MSFSKSKVERFPNSTSKGVRAPLLKGKKILDWEILNDRKRSNMLSSPSTSVMSTSGSSFHPTSSKKDNFKQKRRLKGEDESKLGKVSTSTGKKKSPVKRIPILNRSHNKSVLSKPKSSPVYRGKVLNMTGKANPTTPAKLKRKQCLTPISKKTPTPKKKDSMPTPNRKKFDETSDDMYLTPLASPPDSNSDKSSNDAEDAFSSTLTLIFDAQSQCMEETNISKITGDEDQETFTPTVRFESTRIDVNVTPIQLPELGTEDINGGGFFENRENFIKNEAILTSEEEEEETVTTPGRNPSRKSVSKQNISLLEAFSSNSSRSVGAASFTMNTSHFPVPDDEHTSRISQASRTQQWDGSSGSFDYLNDAFMQLSLQGSERNSIFFQSSANSQPVMWASDSDDLPSGHSVADFPRDPYRQRAQSFSCSSNYDSPGQVTNEESEEQLAPVQSHPSSISSRIGSVFSIIFPNQNKPEFITCAPEQSSAGLNFFTDHNYTEETNTLTARDRDRSRRRSRRRGGSSFFPVTLREIFCGHYSAGFPVRPNRAALGRFARMIRIETLHTLREIRVSVILPTKMYVQSPQFWMPVVEFVAGQAFEITLASLNE